MQKTPRTLAWVVFIVVTLVALGLAIYFYSEARRANQILEGTTPVAPGGGEGGLVSDLTPASLNYDQAVAIFAGKRIQLDDECDASPGRLTATNSTTFMFDNRSRNPVDLYLDGEQYTLPGYGFKLLRLQSDVTPYQVDIGCGSATGGIGSIDLQ